VPDGASPPRPERRRSRLSRNVRRGLLLGLTGLSLYLLAPSLVAVFGSFPKLGDIAPLWLAAMIVLETGSLACVWLLQRLCLRTEAWGPVISSQLAGNAFARVVPGGGAAGAAFQYGMLVDSGIAGSAAASGLAAANVLMIASLLALPVFVLPAIIAGVPVGAGLDEAAWLGAGAFVVMAAAGAVFLATDRPLELTGRAVERLRNRLLPRREPLEGLDGRLLRERDVILRAIGERWGEAVLAAVGRWLLDYGTLVLALAAVGATPDPAGVLLAYAGSQVLTQIPITPGGLGFVEAGLTGLLALAGIGAGRAALAALAYRLVSYWLPLPAGAVAVLVHRRHQRAAAS
jgi:uncharacterized membrane protein YbhN (UPF0104 family)